MKFSSVAENITEKFVKQISESLKTQAGKNWPHTTQHQFGAGYLGFVPTTKV